MTTTTVNKTSVLFLRTALSGIFIVAGIHHLHRSQQIVERMSALPILSTLTESLFPAQFTGVLLFGFGLTFLAGFYSPISASVLAVLLLLITITVQMNNGILFGPLWKNMAIMVGLLFFILNKNIPYTFQLKTKK